MADAGFPLPSSSYRELIKIIQGYERVGSDASLGDVAQLTAIGETIISGNNKFLVAAGIIQGGQKEIHNSVGCRASDRAPTRVGRRDCGQVAGSDRDE
jgi:hypothetical protein